MKLKLINANLYRYKEFWKNFINKIEILKRNNKNCNQILTLELTGELYIFDGNLIKRQNISYQNHLNNAEEYWSSKSIETPEYLFYGEAKVIDIDMI